jgi:hypothetical protein
MIVRLVWMVSKKDIGGRALHRRPSSKAVQAGSTGAEAGGLVVRSKAAARQIGGAIWPGGGAAGREGRG